MYFLSVQEQGYFMRHIRGVIMTRRHLLHISIVESSIHLQACVCARFLLHDRNRNNVVMIPYFI